MSAASVSLLQSADCNYWQVASPGQRRRLLAGFKSFFGASVAPAGGSGRRGPVLTDRQADAVLGRFCRLRFAGAFKLYKLYGRAAAFGGGG